MAIARPPRANGMKRRKYTVSGLRLRLNWLMMLSTGMDKRKKSQRRRIYRHLLRANDISMKNVAMNMMQTQNWNVIYTWLSRNGMPWKVSTDMNTISNTDNMSTVALRIPVMRCCIGVRVDSLCCDGDDMATNGIQLLIFLTMLRHLWFCQN